jgi:hypothetical protein
MATADGNDWLGITIDKGASQERHHALVSIDRSEVSGFPADITVNTPLSGRRSYFFQKESLTGEPA